jgi:hypothetical protein
MDGETKGGHPTRQSDRPHGWKGGGIDQLRLETVSLTTANMCQGNRGEVSGASRAFYIDALGLPLTGEASQILDGDASYLHTAAIEGAKHFAV